PPAMSNHIPALERRENLLLEHNSLYLNTMRNALASSGQIVTKEERNTRHSFARHETFHPRFGWIKKGFAAVAEDGDIFLRDDAHIRLGVGKNMAASIRYWCSAFKVTESLLTNEGRSRSSRPSQFGELLLSGNGWDEFLEDAASLWLLHWNLLKSPCEA